MPPINASKLANVSNGVTNLIPFIFNLANFDPSSVVSPVNPTVSDTLDQVVDPSPVDPIVNSEALDQVVDPSPVNPIATTSTVDPAVTASPVNSVAGPVVPGYGPNPGSIYGSPQVPVYIPQPIYVPKPVIYTIPVAPVAPAYPNPNVYVPKPPNVYVKKPAAYSKPTNYRMTF